MDGTEIRRQIVAQHTDLRGLLGEIETLAKQFEEAVGNTPAVGNQLHERGLALYERFGAHLDSEQELLEPVLRKAGPTGERLARRLRNEHHEQRELLQYLVARLEQHPEPTILIARELQHFVGFLRYEMTHEEETMLAAAALDDSRD